MFLGSGCVEAPGYFKTDIQKQRLIYQIQPSTGHNIRLTHCVGKELLQYLQGMYCSADWSGETLSALLEQTTTATGDNSDNGVFGGLSL